MFWQFQSSGSQTLLIGWHHLEGFFKDSWASQVA